jgi:hypothetical protein
MLDLANFGFFLISVGAAFVAVPDIVSRAADFFRDFKLIELAPNFFLPAPQGFHSQVYYALFVFFLVFGILHIPLLLGRFYFRDRLRKKASTFGSIVFLLGVAYASNLLLTRSIAWFNFVGLFLIMCGASIVIENVIVLSAPKQK